MLANGLISSCPLYPVAFQPDSASAASPLCPLLAALCSSPGRLAAPCQRVAPGPRVPTQPNGGDAGRRASGG